MSNIVEYKNSILTFHNIKDISELINVCNIILTKDNFGNKNNCVLCSDAKRKMMKRDRYKKSRSFGELLLNNQDCEYCILKFNNKTCNTYCYRLLNMYYKKGKNPFRFSSLEQKRIDSDVINSVAVFRSYLLFLQ